MLKRDYLRRVTLRIHTGRKLFETSHSYSWLKDDIWDQSFQEFTNEGYYLRPVFPRVQEWRILFETSLSKSSCMKDIIWDQSLEEFMTERYCLKSIFQNIMMEGYYLRLVFPRVDDGRILIETNLSKSLLWNEIIWDQSF